MEGILQAIKPLGVPLPSRYCHNNSINSVGLGLVVLLVLVFNSKVIVTIEAWLSPMKPKTYLPFLGHHRANSVCAALLLVFFSFFRTKVNH
jgi:hypothetical protein